MTRWAVTGGTGLVGRFIVNDLLARGVTVTVLGRRAPAPGTFDGPVGFLPYDLDDASPDLRGFAGVVHAAFDHVPGRYRGGEGDDPETFRRRNVDGSLRLFETARSAGISRTVFLSSRAVLGGYPAGTTLTEDLPVKPDTLYGAVKAEVETALAAMRSPEFTTLSLRATGVYGPGPGHKWTGLFADHLAGQAQAPRVGTEVHGADLADALWRAVTDGRHDMVHVSDLPVDRHELLTAVNSLTNSENPPPPPARDKVSALDCSRLAGLGWCPRGWDGLRAALPSMLDEAALL